MLFSYNTYYKSHISLVTGFYNSYPSQFEVLKKVIRTKNDQIGEYRLNPQFMGLIVEFDLTNLIIFVWFRAKFLKIGTEIDLFENYKI